MTMTTVFTFGGMDNVSDPVSVGAPDDSAYSTRSKHTYKQCVDLVNCDVDNDLNALRREGSALVAAGNVTSSWSNGVDTFCVMERQIYRMVDDALYLMGNSPNLNSPVEFCQVNDIVLFSDNLTIGYIKDTVPYILSAPAEDIDILDLETWVQLAYPAGADADESNFEIDAFKLATFAGRCLEFFNGSTYLAVDNFIFCTRAMTVAHMDRRYNVVAGFKDPVTMIKGVSDGLFVGTEGGTYFLSGDGVKGSGAGVRGFEQKKILPFGVIYGSAVTIPAGKAAPLKASNDGVAWLTSDGVYMGAEGGQCKDLTESKVTIPSGATAAAMIRKTGDDRHYIVSIGGEAIAVNLSNGAHSRYTNYAFNSLFGCGVQCYGTNSDGVIRLEGEMDYNGAQIDAAILTPVADLGASELKRAEAAFLHVRTAGDMALDVFVDEAEQGTNLPFIAPFQINNGARMFRAKLPRGAKGTNWQFRVTNVDGCRFAAFALKVLPTVLQRTT